jgi:hypothetical protein
MSDNSENITMGLHDILLSMADSLNQTQQQLKNVAPYDSFGRPNTMYQLPYMDFNLELASEFSTATTSTGAMPTGGSRKILFGTIPVRGSSTNASQKIVSTLSGRFVATPPNESLSQITLKVDVELPEKITIDPLNPIAIPDYFEATITIKLEKNQAEPIENAIIECNYNLEKTKFLNGEGVYNPPVFEQKAVKTDVKGIAPIVLKFKPLVVGTPNISHIITINYGTIVKEISINY